MAADSCPTYLEHIKRCIESFNGTMVRQRAGDEETAAVLGTLPPLGGTRTQNQ